MTYRSKYAKLNWNAQGLPYSEYFGDVYYSRADPLGESSYVFHVANKLQDRFENPTNTHFVIGELGFGAGLNFLNTVKLWCGHARSNQVLHYLSFEQFPLTREDINRVLCLFPSLGQYKQILMQVYDPSCTGSRQWLLKFSSHTVILTLCLQDARDELANLANHAENETPPFQVDCWFLDGFAPRCNPELWTHELIQDIAYLSHQQTTLSSYSVAGNFKKALQNAGFHYQKVTGFAGKKHMLHAQASSTFSAPPERNLGTIAIIGSGLAGCALASQLSALGITTHVFDSEKVIASGASGNSRGILHYKPSTQDSLDNYFTLHAYLHALGHYKSLHIPETIFNPIGVVQYMNNNGRQKRFEKLSTTRLYPEEIFSVNESKQQLYFSQAGWLNPAALCQWYLDQNYEKLILRFKHQLVGISPDSQQWELQFLVERKEEIFFRADHVVLCNAADAMTINGINTITDQVLPLIGNLGQVDHFKVSEDLITDQSVKCGSGYVIKDAESVTMGGTYFLGPDTACNRELHTLEHLRHSADLGLEEHLYKHLIASLQTKNRNLLEQRVSVRCTLPDRMPAVGPLDNSHHSQIKGLWLNIAHGSHGLSRTPLAAALIASQMLKVPSPIPTTLHKVVAPQRFWTARDKTQKFYS